MQNIEKKNKESLAAKKDKGKAKVLEEEYFQ